MLLLVLLLEDITTHNFGNLRYFLYLLYMAEWRTIRERQGYEVSIATKEGICRNKKTGKILSNKPDSRGRINWNLYEKGKGIQRQAAVWIALTFPELVEGEWFPGAVIDHKNTDTTDNRPENLKWCTQKENINNPISNERRIAALPRGENHPMYGKHPSPETLKKLSISHLGHETAPETRKKISDALKNKPEVSKRILQFTLDGTFIADYPSIGEAARRTGADKGNISACCRGRLKTLSICNPETGKKVKYVWRFEYEKREP